MNRPNPFVLFVVIVAAAGIMAALGVAQGALLISTHEGDVYHLVDILMRMERGLEPHQDFVTPIGILSFAPIVWLMKQGFAVGHAIILSQVVVAAVLVIPVWYVAWTRLSRLTAYVFAAATMVIALSLTFGGTGLGISTSMHYNRWAWVIAFLMIIIALVPPRSRGALDGVLIGLGFSALALIKVTFVAGLFPGVAVALLLARRMFTIFVAILIGVGVVVAATVLLGTNFWFDYAADLQNVASSEIRPNPGVPLSTMLGHSETLGAIVVALLTYLFVSRAGQQTAAIGLVLLVPGVMYITYQNFGNDPKWLIPFAAVLMALRPSPETEYDGPGLRTAMFATAMACGLIFLPSGLTMALSPVRHAVKDVAEYVPMLPDNSAQLLMRRDRAVTITAKVELDREPSVWAKYRELAEREDTPSLGGVEFEYCGLEAGSLAYFTEISNDIKGFAADDAQIFVVDVLRAFWLFGVGQPLQGGAPWYYGEMSGMENADYILVPKCAFIVAMRDLVLNELAEANLSLSVVRDVETYVLFEINQPPEG